MKPYIHSQRGGIYIIDLIQTAARLEAAAEFLKAVAAGGQEVLFVGTKSHLRSVVKQAATAAAAMPYVTEHWYGGMLTNFDTFNTQVKLLNQLAEQRESGELARMHSKRRLGEIEIQIQKLELAYGGIKALTKLPGALFIADALNDRIAVKEANSLGIPIAGIVDTNADPTKIDWPIPANDDAIKAVELISNFVAEAVAQGVASRKPAELEPTTTKSKKEKLQPKS